MKQTKTTFILTILFSITLFVLGLFTFDKLFELLLPKFDGEFYQVTDIGGDFKTPLLFSLILGLIPIAIYLLWRYSPIISRQKKVASILIIVTCFTLSILVRHQMIKLYFTGLVNNSSTTIEKIKIGFPIQEVHFEYYLCLGLCLGCIISFFLFRQKKSVSLVPYS